MKAYKDQIKAVDGGLSMIMPFSQSQSDSKTWPVIDPRADGGKYIVGLFEGGEAADGVSVHAVSAWTSSKELLATISREVGREVRFGAISPSELRAALPENIAYEISETMLLVGNYSYYGNGEEKNQDQNDQWLFKGTATTPLEQVIKNSAPWTFA